MTAARAAGLLLLLTALATAISVPARLLADADQPTLSDSLWAIAINNAPYMIGGVARLVSGLALLGAAWFLWRSLRGYHPAAVCISAVVLAASGLITAISGLCAVVLAASVPDVGPVGILIREGWEEPLRPWADARWITGTLGFSLAGVGLIALGGALWRIGGRLKIAAVAGLIIGAAMLFIWIDAATVVHRISGIAFLLCLIIGGIWLVAGRLRPANIPSPSMGEG